VFKVLKVDGPNLVTDKGGICLAGFQYADGGKTRPVDDETWSRMRSLFIAAPGLLKALKDLLRETDQGTQLCHVGCVDAAKAAIALAQLGRVPVVDQEE
jgi:hypothetical protein